MSSIRQVMSGINAAVIAATTGLLNDVTPVVVQSAVGWPPLKTLQNVAKGGPQIIGVYDRKVGRDATRWSPFSFDTIVVPATITTSVSVRAIPPFGTSRITFGGSVTPGDAASAVFTNYALTPRVMGASVAIGAPVDTPTTMATQLASLINADPVISTWASAVASGLVVTITNLTKDGMTLASYVGNGGSETTELGRRDRQFQIACWTQTEVLREIVTDPIDVMIAQAEAVFGLTLLDGTQVRLTSESDYFCEDETLAGVYRRDFLIRVDYPVTTTDQLYAIVAPIQNQPPL